MTITDGVRGFEYQGFRYRWYCAQETWERERRGAAPKDRPLNLLTDRSLLLGVPYRGLSINGEMLVAKDPVFEARGPFPRLSGQILAVKRLP